MFPTLNHFLLHIPGLLSQTLHSVTQDVTSHRPRPELQHSHSHRPPLNRSKINFKGTDWLALSREATRRSSSSYSTLNTHGQLQTHCVCVCVNSQHTWTASYTLCVCVYTLTEKTACHFLVYVHASQTPCLQAILSFILDTQQYIDWQRLVYRPCCCVLLLHRKSVKGEKTHRRMLCK